MRKGSLQRAEARKVLGVLTLTTAAAALAAVAATVAVPAGAAPVWRGASADAPWVRADFVDGRPGVADAGWDGAELPGDDGEEGDGGDEGGWTGPGEGGDGSDDIVVVDPIWEDGWDGGWDGGWEDGEVTILPFPGDDCGDCILYTTTDFGSEPRSDPTGAGAPGLPEGAPAAAARESGSDDACKALPGRPLPVLCQP